MADRIPMCRPLLPAYDKLEPYLKRIDTARWYTNAGPLLMEYEARLGELFNCSVVATSSCTSGLIAAIGSTFYQDRVRLPAWSFVATANAAVATGLDLFFVDVEEASWAPPASSIGVSPFGAPFSESSCVIDAAAAFDTYASGQSRVGKSTVVISTHATKVFSTGEGGLVLTKDEKLALRIREVINHGLTYERMVPTPGINAKLSEYHAAVGLASLDAWSATRRKWLYVKSRYIDIFGELAHTVPLSSLSWVGSSFCVRLHGHNADDATRHLAARGIASRKVWGRGVHRYDAYKNYPRSPLPVTEKLADEVLFLPYSIDTTDEQIRHIHGAVIEFLKENKKPNMWDV